MLTYVKYLEFCERICYENLILSTYDKEDQYERHF